MKNTSLLGMAIGLAISAATIYGIVYVAGKGWKNAQK